MGYRGQRSLGPPRRVLAVGAGLVAASAYAGAVGLATGADPYLRHLRDQLPLSSPLLGGLTLAAVVGVPHTVLAIEAWWGRGRVDREAVIAGSLLVGWIVLEALVLDERSLLEPLYAAIGVAVVLAGRRWLLARLPWGYGAEPPVPGRLGPVSRAPVQSLGVGPGGGGVYARTSRRKEARCPIHTTTAQVAATGCGR